MKRSKKMKQVKVMVVVRGELVRSAGSWGRVEIWGIMSWGSWRLSAQGTVGLPAGDS